MFSYPCGPGSPLISFLRPLPLLGTWVWGGGTACSDLEAAAAFAAFGSTGTIVEDCSFLRALPLLGTSSAALGAGVFVIFGIQVVYLFETNYSSSSSNTTNLFFLFTSSEARFFFLELLPPPDFSSTKSPSSSSVKPA